MRDPAVLLANLENTLSVATALSHATANEARTRVEVIDATLETLGWPRADFNPETRTALGNYTDYLLKSHRDPLLVVEAKRIDITFTVPQKYKRRRYQAKFLAMNCGEHLREAMQQAASYCNETGCLYAAVTNGAQWILFRGLGLHRTPWTDFEAILFSSTDDIRTNFGEFVSLLGREAVVAGALVDALRVHDTPPPSFVGRPSSHLPSGDAVSDSSMGKDALVLFRHYFDDIIATDHGQMLRHCFVSDTALNEYEKELQALLKEQRLTIEDLETKDLSKQALVDYVETPDVDKRGRVVLVVGRVGAGKSTFLHKFFSELEEDSGYARFILDLRTEARSVVDPGHDELGRLCATILERVSERYYKKDGFGPEFDPLDGATLRTIYGGLVGRLERGPKRDLYKRNRELFETDLAEELSRAAKDVTDLLPRYIRYVTRRTKRPFCLVFDNVDRASERYERLVYSFAHDLARKIEGVIVLCMRDATFERARRHGFLDATNSDIVFQLQPPNLKQIVSRRIKYLMREAENPQFTPRELRTFLPDVARHGGVLKSLLLGEDESALRLITCLANRSVRRAFYLLERYFRARGAWDSWAPGTGGEHVLRVLMMGRGGPYREAASEVINIFAVPADVHGSYSLPVRILAYLDWANQLDPSLRNSVLVQDIVRDFEAWGFPRSLVTSSLSRLVSVGLIECDQWFADFPEEAGGKRGPYAYDLDYGHRLSLSPRGYFYVHDALKDHLYRSACAGDVVWYDEGAFQKFVAELRQVFSDSTLSARDSGEMLLTSDCSMLWDEYLADELAAEQQSLAPVGDIAWRRHVEQALTVLKPGCANPSPQPTPGGPRRPRHVANAAQGLLFDLDSGGRRLSQVAVGMPSLPESCRYMNSQELPRILWALEFARRAGLGPQIASSLAGMVTRWAGIRMQNTNVARLFRIARESRQFGGFWEEHTAKRRRGYVITPLGQEALTAALDVKGRLPHALDAVPGTAQQPGAPDGAPAPRKFGTAGEQ